MLEMWLLPFVGFVLVGECMKAIGKTSTLPDQTPAKFPSMSVKLEAYAPYFKEGPTMLGYDVAELMEEEGVKFLAVHEFFLESIYNKEKGERFLKYVRITTTDGHNEVYLIGDVHSGGSSNALNVVTMPERLLKQVTASSEAGSKLQIVITPLYDYQPGLARVRVWTEEPPKNTSAEFPFVIVPRDFDLSRSASMLMEIPTIEGTSFSLTIGGKSEERDVFFVDPSTFKKLLLRDDQYVRLFHVPRKDLKSLDEIDSAQDVLEAVDFEGRKLGEQPVEARETQVLTFSVDQNVEKKKMQQVFSPKNY